jgi:type I site-specific restriction-modification system R (restriction) subunit
MFEFSVSKDIKVNNNDKRRIPTNLLANLLPLIIKELKISVSKVGWFQH